MDVVGKARRRTDHLVATLVSLAVLIALADPTAAAAPTGCRVRNLDTGALETSLQAAVDAASPGQHLMLKGTCHGTTSIDKDVSVRGIRTTRPGGPTLDGDGKGTVLTVRRVTVLLEDLTIEGGMALRGSVPKGRRYGGGITNRGGTLTLRDVVVRGNRGLDGGGIFNAGTLVLDGATRIIGNRSWGGGGGIYNTGTLTLDVTSRVSRNHWGGITNRGDLTLNGESTVSANPEWQGMGAVTNYGGTVTMNDGSSIRGNVTGYGLVNESGVVTMTGRSSVSGNWEGVENVSGTLTLDDESRISRNSFGGVSNRSSISGPGVVIVNGSARIIGNGTVRWLQPGHTVAGVWNMGGTVTLNDQARVSRNRNWGVYNLRGGSLTMGGTSHITGNHGVGKRGGGVHQGALTGVVCGPGGNVHSNAPHDCVLP